MFQEKDSRIKLMIFQKFWESLKASLNSEEAKKDVPLGAFSD